MLERGYSGIFRSSTAATAPCDGIATWHPHSGTGPSFDVNVRGVAKGECLIAFRDEKHRSRTLRVFVTVPATPSPSPSPSPTPVAIGTPQPIGTNAADSTYDDSLAIVTSQEVPSHAAIVAIGAEEYVTSGTGSYGISAGCSDGNNDPYVATVLRQGTYVSTVICTSNAIASPLPAGSAVTVTWKNPYRLYNQRAAAWYVTGLASTPLDRSAANIGTNQSPSSGLVKTTSQANELLFGAITDLNGTVASSGFGAGINGTTNPCAPSGTTSYVSLGGVGTTAFPSIFGMYCVVHAPGAYLAGGSFLNPQTWADQLVTLKGAVP
ncbi:MAG: hypothetical protein JO277_10900 [Candidatus Eremiobacteraeota bacterium]|nr:hypothetical protein [Candidatus Eremiobacteraeota bacterium]